MKPSTTEKIPTEERTTESSSTTAAPPGQHTEGVGHLLHGRVALCARRVHLLRRSLRGLDWEDMPAADRDGLESALTGLGADIPLLWLIRGQPDVPEGHESDFLEGRESDV